MITTQQGQILVRELTMEYVRQNNFLHCNKESIPNQIDKIVEISNIISESVEKRYHDFPFL